MSSGWDTTRGGTLSAFDILDAVKHLVIAIPYCLLGGLLMLVGGGKMFHAAYLQALVCFAVGACLGVACRQRLGAG